jgi:hypothetical protein
VDVFSLVGTLKSDPTDTSASGLTSVLAQIAETMVLQTKGIPGEYDLTSDSAQAVAFGAMPSVNIVFVKVKAGGHVKVRFTSSDGATQAVPVDSMLLVISQRVSITAVDITRDPGVETLVDVYLAQAAS